MNLENLKDNYPQLLSRVELSGYSKDYAYRIRKEILRVLEESKSRGWKCYEDICRHYESTLQTNGAIEKKHRIIMTIKRFDLYGQYPDTKISGFKEKGIYPKLILAFKKLVDCYVKVSEERGKKASTIESESSSASNFLFAMQELGFNCLDEITEDAVVVSFVSQDGRQYKGHGYRKSVMALLKACSIMEPEACQKILSFLPMAFGTRKNIQYLTAQEVNKVRAALDDMSNSLTKCDRAIGKLVLYTGLRGCDIAAMNLTSIDWEHDVIRIEQQKTGIPLEIKLTAVVGNAIYEYLTDERRPFQNPALFLAANGPNRRKTPRSMWLVSKRIMKAAGIRQNKDDRKGLHIFRHHLATTLLGNEVSQAVISRMLGHASPRSTETYFSADFVHLKTCALDISRFPLSKGVFCIE